MKFAEYAEYDALGLAELVKRKDVTPEELASYARQAIEARNPKLNAVISALEDQPFASPPGPEQPFSGVPFLVKELVLQAKGAFSRAGSRSLPAIAASVDSNLMQRFRDAGLHLLGTTQSPEMGYNATTETVAFGPVHNPWKEGHSAGGSSGGSGAAVAAGLVPVAHANDGGGSIRVPASCNGLVGLKPSRGRTPTGPGASDPLFGHAIEFALTKSVRDSAALLDCVSGADLGAPYAIQSPTASFLELSKAPSKPLKIAVLRGSMLGTPVHAENQNAVEHTEKLLNSLGHTLVDCDLGLNFEEFAEHINRLWCAFAAQFIDQVTAMTGCAANTDNFEAVTLTCADHGFNSNSVQLLNALDYVNRITRETATEFEKFDALVSPTLGTPPPRHGVMNQNDESISAMDWTRATFKYATNTPLFNSTGQPAISLPLHWTEDALPVGVQFAAKIGQEGLLLNLATQLETEFDWHSMQRKLWQ